MQEEIRNQEEKVKTKKPKTQKQTLPPKQPKTALPKAVQKKAAGKKTSGAAAMCVFLVILILAAVALAFFNVGGMGEAVTAILAQNLPEAENADAFATPKELEQQQAELIKLQETLEKTKQKLDKKDNELSVLEKDIAGREAALGEKMEAFEAESADVYALAAAQKELKSTAQIFEEMDAQKAADVIGKLKSLPSIVALLKTMGKDKAAAILANMEPALASKVLTEMMK